MVRSFVVTRPYRAAAMPADRRPAITVLRAARPPIPRPGGYKLRAASGNPGEPSARGQDGLGEERQADVVAVRDVHVAVVELLVPDLDAMPPDLLGQRPGTPVQAELIAGAAVDVD